MIDNEAQVIIEQKKKEVINELKEHINDRIRAKSKQTSNKSESMLSQFPQLLKVNGKARASCALIANLHSLISFIIKA